MENTDIIVMTAVVVVLFLVFIIATVREFNAMNNTIFAQNDDSILKAETMLFVGKIFADNRIDANNKITIMNALKPIIEDFKQADEIRKEENN